MNRLVALLSILLFPHSLGSQEPLPELVTKQRVENLRYVSNDSKVTYFQNRSGQLSLSKNYQIHSLLEKERWSDYQITATKTEKLVVVTVNEKQHTDLNFLKDHAIYTGNFAETKLELLDQGRDPQLHLEDSWLSFYKPRQKTIHFYFMPEKEKKISIKISAKTTPFFFPHITMLNNQTILYTDINVQGQSAIMHFDATTKEIRPLYQSTKQGTKLELCYVDNKIIVGEFSYTDIGGLGKILVFDLEKSPQMMKHEQLYSSHLPDIGNMLCDDEQVYFIKTLKENTKLNKKTTEVAKLDLKSKEVKVLSNLLKINHLIQMGEQIYIPFRNTMYVVKGRSNLKKDTFDNSKAKEKRNE